MSLRSGRMLDAATAHRDGTIDALVSEGFAQARGIAPGATLSALIDGKRRTLRIVGVALSPEYIFAGFGGMPDMRGIACKGSQSRSRLTSSETEEPRSR